MSVPRTLSRRLLLLVGLLLIALAILQPDRATLRRWVERLQPLAGTPAGPVSRPADAAPSPATANGDTSRDEATAGEASDGEPSVEERPAEKPRPSRSVARDRPAGANAGLVAPASLPAVFEARVVKVRDGDTIDVLLGDGRKARVRLHGIDAPEYGQRFHRQATAFVRERIDGQRVRIERVDIDDYDRLIGQIWMADQRFNAEVVRAGWAWRYRQYAPDDAELQAAESQARSAKRGLWADPRPLPPWVWRRQNRR
jgi:endonuclease YncB( thermonuclease family)